MKISVKSVERKRTSEIPKYFRLFIQDKTIRINIEIDLIIKQMMFLRSLGCYRWDLSRVTWCPSPFWLPFYLLPFYLLSTPTIWLPPCSLPWGHCPALFSTWNITIFGITQTRLYFSRILITDPQLPSNFVQCYLYKIYLAHPIFAPPFSSCSTISFLVALTIF